MNYFEALDNIQKKELQSIYLLQGTESYLIENVIQALRKQTISSQNEEANFIRYDLEETAIQEVLMDVETYPFFGVHKIVVASHPLFLTAKPDKTGINHQMEALIEYIANPVDYTTLILVAPYEKLDERKKIVKLLKKHADIIVCQPVNDWDIDKWIDHLAKQLHIRIEKAAYEVIVQETGTNLLLLEKELEKLALYVGDGGVITVTTAEALLSHQSTTKSGLKLVDAVIAKDLTKAIQLFQDLSKIGEDEVALIALVASQFRTITHVKTLQKSGYSQKQMAQQLKVHPYVIKMAMTREKYFSRRQLESILNQAAITDMQIKQGKMDKRLAFELFLYQIIQSNVAS